MPIRIDQHFYITSNFLQKCKRNSKCYEELHEESELMHHTVDIEDDDENEDFEESIFSRKKPSKRFAEHMNDADV